MYILYNFISFKRYLFFILASLLFRHFKWNIYIYSYHCYKEYTKKTRCISYTYVRYINSRYPLRRERYSWRRGLCGCRSGTPGTAWHGTLAARRRYTLREQKKKRGFHIS